MTHWVGRAQQRIHDEHKNTIINTFRRLGLSLNPNGSKDTELKIKDLPGITVGDQQLSDPKAIPDDEEETIDVDDGLLYTTEELANSINTTVVDEDLVTTDTDEDTQVNPDSSDDDVYDDEVDGDAMDIDMNM